MVAFQPQPTKAVGRRLDERVNMATNKELAEQEILRGFIEFVNRQVGVYCDCLGGFEGNRVRTERQVAIVNHPTHRRWENGTPVIVWNSVEDPTRPDIIHNRTVRADEYISLNSEAGFNEQQICWSIIVFMFTYWDEVVRPEIARVRGVQPNDIRIEAFGDLRIMRKAIVHNKGVVTQVKHMELKVLAKLCEPGVKIAPTHEQMHSLFVAIKKAIAGLLLEYSGHLPGAPSADEIVDVAIQRVPRK